MTEQSLSYRPDLQGLRAIAILLVIFTHAGTSFLPGGFIGVDVFYVLSGYLITGLLLHELHTTGRISFLRFYARRLKRLLPALMLTVAVSSCLAVWMLSLTEARTQLASGQYAATWTSNFYFAFRKVDYFAELANYDLFLHTWSLGVEEQFYLIWPVILVALSGLGKLPGIGREHLPRLVFYGLFALSIASFALAFHWTFLDPAAAFYLMPSRIWQLGVGGIIYLLLAVEDSIIKTHTIQLGKAWALLLFGIGLTLILGSAYTFSANHAYPGYLALAPTSGTALVILAGYSYSHGRSGPLTHPALVWLGDRSYSLYLWHWPLLALGYSLGYEGRVVPTMVLLLLTLLAAILSYRLVELPFWKGGYSRAEPLLTIQVCMVIMLSVLTANYHGQRYLSQIENLLEKGNRARLDMPALYNRSCDDWHASARVLPCEFGPHSAARTVVLLGDSIGVQWFSMVTEIFPAPNWRTIVLTKSACPMVDENYFYAHIGHTYQVCTDWRNAVLNWLDAHKPDVLIIGSSVNYDFTETQWIKGSARIFDRISKAAGQVLVMAGTPSLGFDGPGCVSRLSAQDLYTCQAEARLEQAHTVTHYLTEAAGRYANVHLLDLNDLVCPDGYCAAINQDDVVIFRDSMHLTDTFVRVLTPKIRQRMERFVQY